MTLPEYIAFALYFVLRLSILLTALKAITIGSEYNIVKRFREGRSYTTKYDKWMKGKP